MVGIIFFFFFCFFTSKALYYESTITSIHVLLLAQSLGVEWSRDHRWENLWVWGAETLLLCDCERDVEGMTHLSACGRIFILKF